MIQAQLTQNPAQVPCLGAMMGRNEKRTQRFVVGSLQNLLGATGNSQTSVDSDVEKMRLENEVPLPSASRVLWVSALPVPR